MAISKNYVLLDYKYELDATHRFQITNMEFNIFSNYIIHHTMHTVDEMLLI